MFKQRWIQPVSILLLLGGFVWALFVFVHRTPITEPVTPPSTPPSVNTTGIPLTLPKGFNISLFAKNLPEARVMAFDSKGNMWVSQSRQNAVSLLEIENGVVTHQSAILKNLNSPHGLAFDPKNPTTLFVAEEDKIIKVLTYSDAPSTKIASLPSRGGHFTRTLGFGPDGKLYVSIGSSCNVCNESDNRRAKIFTLDTDGSDFKEFARGLRNSVFFTWHPSTKAMWATEMGRDLLGDDVPPDEINIIKNEGNFGWPICYGKNMHDTAFDNNTYIRNPCMEPFETPSFIDLQAHSAPLGLAFIPSSWPAEYRDDLLVAYHGSWNRTTPTGYKIVRIKLDASGTYQGTEDFITGWRTESKLYGRPVDVTFDKAGSLYISDDESGVIYKLEPAL